ncbi:membrane-bound lytic murein transglycosylase D [Tamilnaduibacter salinus]|uniref:Membrane-bound lytic murein transglycosylase D n=1 Tax=Tamilnaduibacter salinus TaxID=1484056 RepID=A0A2U1CZJ8_9GAMM|nr:LysM peptidoglycan-binding domain-containing protein [Tamilnaduibacter salinus]PVY78218.1 membrane-bound lytic murein transglycosylase D [Tamilnaduibacter salinus]
MPLARFTFAFAIITFLTACQHFQSADTPSEEELMTSESVTVATGDEALKASVSEPTDVKTQTPQRAMDDAIDTALKDRVSKARDRLDEPKPAGTREAEKPRPDLWDRLRSLFALNLDQSNRRIEQQLNWYANHPRYIERVANRAQRYFYHVVNEVEKRGLPGEYALLPVVESAYDPFAYSHGRAAGLWQFIPSTGRAYGLDQSWWHDGRRDVIASTDAALRYLDALSQRFDGNHLLGLASYNSGAGTVLREQRQNRRQGKPTDYWSLQLPKETRAYVPKLIAISKLIRDPEKYGIELPPMPDKPYFEVINTGGQMDLARASEMSGVDIEEIYLLNPSYNRWATQPDGPHRLLIPVAEADTFRKALSEMPPSERVSWRHYKVRSGDTLIRIADRYNTTPDVIRRVNEMRSNLIRVGQRLLIPTASKGTDQYAMSASQRLARQQASTDRREDGTRIEHIVQTGDTFWDIARDNGVSVRELAKWNGMAPGDPLVPGQRLVIWSERDSSTLVAARQASSDRDMVRRVGYEVRKGDSLARIASRFNVNVRDIADWNSLDIDRYLQPGQSLVLYVDIRRSP